MTRSAGYFSSVIVLRDEYHILAVVLCTYTTPLIRTMFREDSWKIVNFAQNQMKPTDEKPLILPSLFCPAASYYAMMAEAGHVVVNTGMRFDKRRKEVHRCVIADTRGPLELTVPIAKPYGRTWD